MFLSMHRITTGGARAPSIGARTATRVTETSENGRRKPWAERGEGRFVSFGNGRGFLNGRSIGSISVERLRYFLRHFEILLMDPKYFQMPVEISNDRSAIISNSAQIDHFVDRVCYAPFIHFPRISTMMSWT
jgi:hypothetical protein